MKLRCEKRKSGNMWNSNWNQYSFIFWGLETMPRRMSHRFVKSNLLWTLSVFPIKSLVTGVFQPFSAIDIQGWRILCCEDCPVLCRLFSSILVLYPLAVSTIPQPLPNFCCDTCQTCLQILVNIFLRSDITPENHRAILIKTCLSVLFSETRESARVLETTFSLFTDKKVNT